MRPFIYNYIYLGLLISGGYFTRDTSGTEVEVFVPSTGQHCQLPNLPAMRFGHSMKELTLCGGGLTSDTRTSCLTLTDDGWQRTTTLTEERYSN